MLGQKSTFVSIVRCLAFVILFLFSVEIQERKLRARLWKSRLKRSRLLWEWHCRDQQLRSRQSRRPKKQSLQNLL